MVHLIPGHLHDSTADRYFGEPQERKFEKEEKEENFHRVERRYGTFYRSFTIPSTVNPENVKAGYDAGALRLELEKRAEARPKQIKIGVGSSSKNVEARNREVNKDVKPAA